MERRLQAAVQASFEKKFFSGGVSPARQLRLSNSNSGLGATGDRGRARAAGVARAPARQPHRSGDFQLCTMFRRRSVGSKRKLEMARIDFRTSLVEETVDSVAAVTRLHFARLKKSGESARPISDRNKEADHLCQCIEKCLLLGLRKNSYVGSRVEVWPMLVDLAVRVPTKIPVLLKHIGFVRGAKTEYDRGRLLVRVMLNRKLLVSLFAWVLSDESFVARWYYPYALFLCPSQIQRIVEQFGQLSAVAFDMSVLMSARYSWTVSDGIPGISFHTRRTSSESKSLSEGFFSFFSPRRRPKPRHRPASAVAPSSAGEVGGGSSSSEYIPALEVDQQELEQVRNQGRIILLNDAAQAVERGLSYREWLEEFSPRDASDPERGGRISSRAGISSRFAQAWVGAGGGFLQEERESMALTDEEKKHQATYFKMQQDRIGEPPAPQEAPPESKRKKKAKNFKVVFRKSVSRVRLQQGLEYAQVASKLASLVGLEGLPRERYRVSLLSSGTDSMEFGAAGGAAGPSDAALLDAAIESDAPAKLIIEPRTPPNGTTKSAVKEKERNVSLVSFESVLQKEKTGPRAPSTRPPQPPPQRPAGECENGNPSDNEGLAVSTEYEAGFVEASSAAPVEKKVRILFDGEIHSFRIDAEISPYDSLIAQLEQKFQLQGNLFSVFCVLAYGEITVLSNRMLANILAKADASFGKTTVKLKVSHPATASSRASMSQEVNRSLEGTTESEGERGLGAGADSRRDAKRESVESIASAEGGEQKISEQYESAQETAKGVVEGVGGNEQQHGAGTNNGADETPTPPQTPSQLSSATSAPETDCAEPTQDSEARADDIQGNEELGAAVHLMHGGAPLE